MDTPCCIVTTTSVRQLDSRQQEATCEYRNRNGVQHEQTHLQEKSLPQKGKKTTFQHLMHTGPRVKPIRSELTLVSR